MRIYVTNSILVEAFVENENNYIKIKTKKCICALPHFI